MYPEEEVEAVAPYAAADVDEHAYVGVGDGAFQCARRLEEQLGFLTQAPSLSFFLAEPKTWNLTPYAEDLLGLWKQKKPFIGEPFHGSDF